MLYPARISFRFKGEIKDFTDKQKSGEFNIYSGNRKKIYIYVVTRDLGCRPFSSIKYLHEPEISLLMQNYDVYSYLSQRFMRRT